MENWRFRYPNKTRGRRCPNCTVAYWKGWVHGSLLCLTAVIVTLFLASCELRPERHHPAPGLEAMR